MRRALLSWTLVIAFLAAGFGASVLALNGDVYSAHGFVRSYLETLARKNADEALAFAGVVAPASESGILLTDDAMGDIADIHYLSDVETAGVHTVTFSYQLSTGLAATTFTVSRVGTSFGLFATWRFAASPLANLAVTVLHDSRFTANGLPATGDDTYAVFTPGLYDLGHETEYLTARTLAVPVTEVGSTVDAEVDVEANGTFERAASHAVASFLDSCATQQVLMPTGCPFGFEEANRIEGLPEWSMVGYPTITLEPSDTVGVWNGTSTKSSVKIKVAVRSLFDGSTTTVNQDVQFTGTYRITVAADDTLSVSAQL